MAESNSNGPLKAPRTVSQLRSSLPRVGQEANNLENREWARLIMLRDELKSKVSDQDFKRVISYLFHGVGKKIDLERVIIGIHNGFAISGLSGSGLDLWDPSLGCVEVAKSQMGPFFSVFFGRRVREEACIAKVREIWGIVSPFLFKNTSQMGGELEEEVYCFFAYSFRIMIDYMTVEGRKLGTVPSANELFKMEEEGKIECPGIIKNLLDASGLNDEIIIVDDEYLRDDTNDRGIDDRGSASAVTSDADTGAKDGHMSQMMVSEGQVRQMITNVAEKAAKEAVEQMVQCTEALVKKVAGEAVEVAKKVADAAVSKTASETDPKLTGLLQEIESVLDKLNKSRGSPPQEPHKILNNDGDSQEEPDEDTARSDDRPSVGDFEAIRRLFIQPDED